MRRLLPALLFLAACAPQRPAPPAPQAVPEDTAYVLIRPHAMPPTPIHLAVRAMLLQCAGRERIDRPLLTVAADTIIGLPSNRLLYGVTVQIEPGVLMAIETASIHNAAALSHEYLHALHLHEPHDGPFIDQCTLHVGLDLPERPLPNAESYARRADAVVIRMPRQP